MPTVTSSLSAENTFTSSIDLSGADADVAAIAGAVFTDEAKAAYAAAQQEA